MPALRTLMHLVCQEHLLKRESAGDGGAGGDGEADTRAFGAETFTRVLRHILCEPDGGSVEGMSLELLRIFAAEFMCVFADVQLHSLDVVRSVLLAGEAAQAPSGAIKDRGGDDASVTRAGKHGEDKAASVGAPGRQMEIATMAGVGSRLPIMAEVAVAQ